MPMTHNTVHPRLEALESQGELIKLISDSIAGMADARKCLQGLGKNPKAPDVHHITSRATCLE